MTPFSGVSAKLVLPYGAWLTALQNGARLRPRMDAWSASVAREPDNTITVMMEFAMSTR